MKIYRQLMQRWRMRCDVCRTPLPGSGPPNGTAPWYICRQCQRGGATLSCALLTLALFVFIMVDMAFALSAAGWSFHLP